MWSNALQCLSALPTFCILRDYTGAHFMSISITINHALKAYENKNVVIPDLNLAIKEGEFFTLLGPSGCGKTTLLRMIAGFNSIEGGDFYFGEKRINDLEPSKRNIGMVFQNYAIFPHLTVEQNVAFGLKNRKLPADEIQATTDKFLKLMQIEEFRKRKPDRLSGGQQQRVALARALAIKPDVLLMDEPLSNLDAKLRLEMRQAIRNIQKEIGITTVYVTHDQEEAMAVSDRIAVMNHGVIQQIGAPRELYLRPANVFVATFIGHTNIMKGTMKRGNLTFGNGYTVAVENLSPDAEGNALVSVRPEEFVIENDMNGAGIRGTVADSTFLGLNTQYIVELETGEKVEIIRESYLKDSLQKGSEVRLTVNAGKINVFNDDEASASVMQ